MAIIQQPDAMSMSGNIKKFIVSSGETVSFVLKDGATVLLDASYEPGADGRVTIDVKDIVESRLSFLLSSNNFYEQSNLVKVFIAIIDSVETTFKVIRTGVANLADTPANWLKGNFLTWQPTSKPVTYYSPEWLTYYAVEACTIKLKATFPDNTEQTVTIGSCEAGKAFTCNVQYAVVAGLLGQVYPSYYEVWAEKTGGTRLTYIQRYMYSEPKSEQEQWFLFENSLGGIDTLRAYGDTDFEGDHVHNISSIDGTSSEYRIDTKRSYNKNTGYLDEYERRWLLDFFPSQNKFVHSAGAIRSVIVTDSDVKYTASDLPSSYNFKYRFADESAALLNLIRNEDAIPADIVIPDIDSPDFSLPPRLSEYPRVQLHGGVIIPAFDPNSSNPTVTTLAAIIASAIGETIDHIPGSESGGQLVKILKTLDESPATDENVFSSLRVIAEILKNNETFKDLYLSKRNDDTAQGIIKFIKGIEVGQFISGLFGSGASLKNDNGISRLEVDHLLVRMRAEFFSILVNNAKHVGGQQINSAANMICIKVEETTDFYRCYFDTGNNNEVINLFENTDRARCQVFTGSGQKFYWRKVLAVGPNYIELSKTDCAPGTNDVPAVGDHIFQLGSDNPDRQGAWITSSVGPDAPYMKQYSGIDGYTLADKELTIFTRLGNRIVGKTVFLSTGQNLEDWSTGTAQDIQDAQGAANAAALAAQQAIDDAATNVGLINTEVGKLQAQIDGEVSNWFYPYSPTLANYPASDWTTNAIKDRHIGDTFTNTQQAPATDAGKSWRFVKNGTVYSWTQIADSDAVLALQKAAQAQSTADGKSTTYLIQPTSYKLGDMWVLAADQTVNGVAYKSGEILTATQDSTAFVQAHWVKKVRYTDDTAVNNLQIGGRNYFTLSTNLTCWRTDNGSTLYPIERFIGGFAYNLINGVGSNIRISNNLFKGLWTMSFDVISSAANQVITIDFGDTNLKNYTTHETTNTRKHITYTAENTGSFAFFDIALSAAINDIRIENLKIEKYGKETDFSESPEDTASRINSAKQEALTAAGNAQTSANNANTAVGDLNTYVDGSFKDGVIEASEAKAIEKYINVVNTEKSNLEATYNTLYTNTYLEGTPKTNLLNAKVTYFGAVDTLINSINTAITDGRTTVAEKQAVDTNYSSYKTALASLQTAIENANKAIQAKLDSISKGYVDELAVGGANLVQALSAWTLGAGWQLISDTLVNTTSSTFNHCQSPNFNLVAGKRYVITALVEDIAGNGVIQIHNGATSRAHVVAKKGDNLFEFTAVATEAVHIRVCGNTTTIYKIKNIVVRSIGVQERIDISKLTAEQAQLAADGYMRARYVRDWVKGSSVNNDNHWSEIKITNKAGTNLALSQVPTSNGTFHTGNPAQNSTDNNLSTYSSIAGTGVSVYAQIDLGQIYYDIDYIQIWHYYLDGRTYYGTKTEISTDGVNWTPVFDSAKSGTYKETAAGNIISLRPHEVLAKTLKSQAITDKFGTTIDGGLIGAVTMLLRELNSTDETAGISGIRGANRNLPAFWTGTYADAIAGTAGIIFRHNSTGKIGVLDVDANGNVKLLDAADPNLIRLIFSKSQIPLVADILSSTQFGQSVTNLSSTGSTTGSTTLANGLSVTKDGSELTFSGILSVYAILDFAHGYTSGYAEISISLFKNGSYYAALSSVGGSLDASMDIINETYNLNSKLIVPSGNYTIVVQRIFYGVRNQTGGISNTSTFAWSFVKDIRRFEFGLDGYMSWYTNCHSHFTENGGYDGRAPYNKWNMPGVLAAGSSTSGGAQTNVWGAKSSSDGVTTITSPSAGFRVPLSGLSHSNYVVQITPHTNTTFRVGTKTSTYFEIYGSGGFDYVVIGNNY